MRIGELARATRVPTKTIRFYEDTGVLPPAERLDNGYRDYGPEAVDRLVFIKDAQAAGLSLDEIKTVLDLRSRGESTCEHIMHLLEHHLEQVEKRIAALRKTQKALKNLTERARSLDPARCHDPNRCQTIEEGLHEIGGLEPAAVHTGPSSHRH